MSHFLKVFCRVTLLISLFSLLIGCGDEEQAPLKTEGEPPAKIGEYPMIKIETTLGDILVRLNAEKAPITVENFLSYADSGFYEGTVFHRVIPGFMIQGGGMTADMADKTTEAPIKNEADNGLENKRGTLAMARTPSPNSATSQFFINTTDNAFLNFQEPTAQGWGYAVFAEVVEGMDVVDKISAQETTSKQGHQDVPVQTIEILSVTRLDQSDETQVDSAATTNEAEEASES